jgi:hypothetical protein
MPRDRKRPRAWVNVLEIFILAQCDPTVYDKKGREVLG